MANTDALIKLLEQKQNRLKKGYDDIWQDASDRYYEYNPHTYNDDLEILASERGADVADWNMTGAPEYYQREISPIRKQLADLTGLPSHAVVPYTSSEQSAHNMFHQTYPEETLAEYEPTMLKTTKLGALAKPSALKKLANLLRGL